MGWFDDTVAATSDWLGTPPNTADPATATGGAALEPATPDTWWGTIGQTIGDVGRGIDQEGLGAVLDPGGVIDRQRAQRELSDRFQVVNDGFAGPRDHNQVSEADYERIAHTFSDIRLGRGDLTIDGGEFSPFAWDDRATWEAGMQSSVADMMMTTTGREQIFGMSNNVVHDDAGNARHSLWGYGPERHGETTIEPLFGSTGRDPSGQPTWVTPDWFDRDAKTLSYDNAFTVGNTGMSRQPTGARGDGGDALVEVNPGKIDGLRSDVVLAHEMQHALNDTQGTNGTGWFSTAGPDAYVSNRERQAVGLPRTDTSTGGRYPDDPRGCTENTYRFERNELGDRFLPRERYGELPTEASSTKELNAAWRMHHRNASGG